MDEEIELLWAEEAVRRDSELTVDVNLRDGDEVFRDAKPRLRHLVNPCSVNTDDTNRLLRAFRWGDDGDEVVREALGVGEEEIVDARELGGADD